MLNSVRATASFIGQPWVTFRLQKPRPLVLQHLNQNSFFSDIKSLGKNSKLGDLKFDRR